MLSIAIRISQQREYDMTKWYAKYDVIYPIKTIYGKLKLWKYNGPFANLHIQDSVQGPSRDPHGNWSKLPAFHRIKYMNKRGKMLISEWQSENYKKAHLHKLPSSLKIMNLKIGQEHWCSALLQHAWWHNKVHN